MFCAIVSLSIIKYQYFRFPSECSMLPSHETWNLFSCKFNILTLTVLKQCWLQLLACNLNARYISKLRENVFWKHLFLFLLSYHGQILFAPLACWRLKRETGTRQKQKDLDSFIAVPFGHVWSTKGWRQIHTENKSCMEPTRTKPRESVTKTLKLHTYV